MYAKIIDEKTKQVEVGIGTDSDFYQSIGMTEQEVEQAWDGQWYIKGYAPGKPTEQLAAEKRAERDAALNAVLWRAERYERQKPLDIETTDTEETYLKLLEYLQYLRNIPQDSSFPELEVLSFDAWLAQNTAKASVSTEELPEYL